MRYEIGKTYEQLRVGEKASFSKTISQADISLFAGICGDFNPVHVNQNYAAQTRFKRCIAHGPLTQSLMAPVLGTRLPGLGSIALEFFCRYTAPVYPGDTITATAEVAEKLPPKKRVRMTLTWENQHGERVAEGYCLMMPPRDGGA